MKKVFLNCMLLLCALIAGSSSVWATDYSTTYDYSALGSMISGNYTDATSYWKVPETAGNSATIAIPITYQPTSDITLTFNIATFGSGTNPSSSNTTITAVGTETGSNWSGSNVSSYPSSSTYVNGVMTITKPVSPTTLGGLTVTMGVNSGIKIFRLQSITISYTYTASSDPSSEVAFANESPQLDLKNAATYTQVATTADGYIDAGGSVTYSMTANTAGATINGSTGVVTPTKAGSVTVQAAAAAVAGHYAASYASYTLTVKDTREWDVTCHIGNNTSIVTRTTGSALSLDNPSAICGMAFVGWSSTDDIDDPTWVANTTKVTDDMELYAIFEEKAGKYSYRLVESSLADWRGDYLIAYSSSIFADGRTGGTSGIGANGSSVNPSTNLNGKVVAASWGDTYNVTIEAINDANLSAGYLLKTKDDKYNYQTSNANGLASTDTRATAATYPLSVTYNSASDIDIANSAGAQFHYNTGDDGYFRFYKNGGQSSVYLYKRTEDDAPVYSLGLTASFTIAEACTDGAKYYATYSNSSAFIVPDGLTVSEISVIDGELLVDSYSKGDIVPANTGVMVSSSSFGSKTVALTTTDGTSVLDADNFLMPTGEGIYSAAMAAASASGTKFYRLTMHNADPEHDILGTIGFWYGAEGGVAFEYSTANRAYLAVPSGAQAPARFWFTEEENNATNIEAVEAAEEGVKFIQNGKLFIKKNGVVYDMLGTVVR